MGWGWHDGLGILWHGGVRVRVRVRVRVMTEDRILSLAVPGCPWLSLTVPDCP